MHSPIPKAYDINFSLISLPHLLLTLSRVFICEEKELLKFMQPPMSHAEVLWPDSDFLQVWKQLDFAPYRWNLSSSDYLTKA